MTSEKRVVELAGYGVGPAREHFGRHAAGHRVPGGQNRTFHVVLDGQQPQLGPQPHEYGAGNECAPGLR